MMFTKEKARLSLHKFLLSKSLTKLRRSVSLSLHSNRCRDQMGTIVQSTSCLSWKRNQLQIPSQNVIAQDRSQSPTKTAACSTENPSTTVKKVEFSCAITRRAAIASGIALVSSAAFGFPGDGSAVVKQGLLAGRIPGLSEPDEQGWRTYTRPEDKSGGHGVGWSPIIPYKFSVPEDWDEVPVSIADLGGTEIDLRFASPKEGRLFVIVAPVLRFADNLGDNATIDQIGTPEKVISAFGPEVIGENVEGKVLSSEVAEYSGRKYYQFELEPPHVIITATAAGNRLYLFNVTGKGLQWKKYYKDLKRISDSFRVI